jgi:putative membrane protein
LIVGFKNLQTYNRTWEARQIWGDISSSSRAWGAMSRDFVDHAETSTALVYRHLAWLAALRYQLRENRTWETTSQAHDAEYLKYYSIPERQTALATELAKYLPEAELKQILATGSKATQIMSLQSQTIKGLFASQAIVVALFADMQRALKEFLWHQGRCERLKDFPYPRQYATIKAFFIKLFCLLLPFGLLREFDKLNDSVEGVIKGHMVWLVIPFSVLISWMYTSLERVGESTENPFAGSANDVPISQLCRTAEIELRDMLGETDVPPPLEPRNNIVL